MRNANQNPNNIPEPPMYLNNLDEYWAQNSWFENGSLQLGNWLKKQRDQVKNGISSVFGVKFLSRDEKAAKEYDKDTQEMSKLGIERSISKADYVNLFKETTFMPENPKWQQWHNNKNS